MPFPSIHFLFVFLPIALILYFILPYKWWRNSILLIASLIFYGWGEPIYILLLIGSILFNYLLANGIGFFQSKEKQGTSKAIMVIAVVGNLALLGFYKYSGFVLANIQSLFGLNLPDIKTAFPLGISFYTFMGISYVVDVYQKVDKAETNLINFGVYMAMFPKLIQGPITRFGQVKKSLSDGKANIDDISAGTRRLIGGLAKKVLIADNIAVVANKVFSINPNYLGMDVAWLGLIAYTLQIYFDFSGYTDMAVGVGKILGFQLPENFNFPYVSKNIADFWRRWHMSLTSWFRVYVFIPLEFARKREKHLRQQSNIVIVFLLTGLWHGASWNFVIWGTYFGIILALESGWLGKKLKKIPTVFQHIYALLLILIGWVFFRLTDIGLWGSFFKALVGGNGLTGLATFRSLNIMFYIPLMLLAIPLCTPILKQFSEKARERSLLPSLLVDTCYILVFVLSIAFILSNGYNSFLYSEF